MNREIGPALVDRIDGVLRALLRRLEQVQGLVLTEDDLKCQLVADLLALPELREPSETADAGVLGGKVHTEVSWFDEQSKLSLKPDLTITDPRLLSIYRPMQKEVMFPRKGFHFTGDAIVFELKFFRGRGGISPRCIPSIQRDAEKLGRLIEKARREAPHVFLYGFVVAVSKFAGRCEALQAVADQINQNDRMRLIAGSANCRERAQRGAMQNG